MLKKIYDNYIIILFSIMPAFMALVILQYLPLEVPMRYGLDASVQEYGNKYSSLIFPFIVLATSIVDFFRKDIQFAITKTYKIYFLIFFNILNIFFLYGDLRESNYNGINLLRCVSIILAIIIMTLGNLLPKLRQNSYLGIRNKYTLSNERIWKYIHTLYGRVIFFIGLISIPLSIILELKIFIVI